MLARTRKNPSAIMAMTGKMIEATVSMAPSCHSFPDLPSGVPLRIQRGNSASIALVIFDEFGRVMDEK